MFYEIYACWSEYVMCIWHTTMGNIVWQRANVTFMTSSFLLSLTLGTLHCSQCMYTLLGYQYYTLLLIWPHCESVNTTYWVTNEKKLHNKNNSYWHNNKWHTHDSGIIWCCIDHAFSIPHVHCQSGGWCCGDYVSHWFLLSVINIIHHHSMSWHVQTKQE